MREVPSIPAGLEPKLRNVLSAVRESLNAAIKNINLNTESLAGMTQWIQPALDSSTDIITFNESLIQAPLESATGADGAAGINARAVTLTTPDQAFTYDSNGANPSPINSAITATIINTLGVVYYEFFLNDVSTGTATTSNVYTYTPQASFGSMPDKLEVQIREDSITGPIEARDMMTMIGLRAGAHGITVGLSNEAHTLPKTIANVVTYTGSGTKINVWEGATALTEDSSSPYANSTFRVTATGTSITPGAVTGTGTATLTYGDSSAMTTDPAKIIFTIIAKRADGTEITIPRQQSLSFSQQGATGSPGSAGGDSIDIVFVRSATQPATPTASPGTPTAPITWYTDVASVPASANPLWASTGFKASASANYIWDLPIRIEGASVAEVTVFTRGVPTSTPTGGTYTFSTPPVLAVPTSTGATWTTYIPSGSAAVYTSRAVVSAAAGYSSAVSITGWTTPVISFQNGADAVLSDLSNDNHTVPTDSSGSNGNFTGCATTMSVFIGSADDSANWTYAVTKSAGVTCTEAITSRTQTVTAMTSDIGTVTIVASKNGYASLTQVFSISKAKSGVAYSINLSNNSVRKSSLGVLNPASLTLTASKIDIAGVTAYTGRFKIYLNGSGTATYTSATDEASHPYTVTGTDTTIKCELYLAGGTTTLVDTETVLVVADGTDGADGADGADGTNGTSVYTGTIYQQITTATAPSGGTYNFSTGTLTAPASWSTTPPTTTTTPTWACDYTFSTTTPATSVTALTWTNLHIDMVKGDTGITGTRTAVLDLYQWGTTTAPTLFPSGTSTYYWSTGQFTNPATLNSWTQTPASPTAGQVLYVCHAFFADSLTTPTSPVTWSTTVAIVSTTAGTNGSPGAAGDSVDIIFKRGVDATTAPTITSPSTNGGTGWTTTVPAATQFPVWSSTGFQIASTGNYTWQAPVKIEGANVAEVTLYTRTANPAVPTGATYTFGIAAPLVPAALSIWSVAIPIGTAAVYTSRAVVSAAAGYTSAVGITGWTTPVISLQNGTDGQRVGFLELYKWSAAAPTTYPSGTSTYNWSDGTFTSPLLLGASSLNGWALVPATAVAGQSLWGISATISNTSTTATDTATWSSTSPYVVGYAGGNGVSTNVLELYSTSATALIGTTTYTYDFSSDNLTSSTGTFGSWSRAMPATTTTATYMTTCSYSVTAPTTSLGKLGSAWSTPIVVAQNGSIGPDGARGNFTAVIIVPGKSWPDGNATVNAQAYAAIIALPGSGGVLRLGDSVAAVDTLTSPPGATWVLTKQVTAVGNPGTWSAQAKVLDGNLLVTGSVKAAMLQAGVNPLVSGTTMSGQGGIINSDGTFALGNPVVSGVGGNISYNGTTMTLNGNVVGTGNIGIGNVTENSIYNIGFTNLTGTNVSNGTATTVLMPSISVPNVDVPITRIVIVSFTLDHNDTTPGYFSIELGPYAYICDPPTRQVASSSTSSYSFTFGVPTTSGITNIGQLSITLSNGASLLWNTANTKNITGGKVVVFSGKR